MPEVQIEASGALAGCTCTGCDEKRADWSAADEDRREGVVSVTPVDQGADWMRQEIDRLNVDLDGEREAHAVTARKLAQIREVVLEATIENVSDGRGCWPGARDFLESCGIEIPTENRTYSVTASYSAVATVTVDVEVDMIDASEGSPEIDRQLIAERLTEELDYEVDYYSVTVDDIEEV